ncbi:unnamed protein product [Rhizoctonia solani]|uniref:Uncharacterized protein n=1 Tax=Rhizoctonia solani TaxID=456999 RepID=A0A8H3D537_9AGAM|nr:unnamed protein product [Rhizoctonia solani]CAE6508016.1 unnamed protein product [Rhizoctonia solani]
MGRRLAYPDVPPATIYEIYKQSLRKPIHAYGIFVDPIALYNRLRGRPESPDACIMKDQGLFLSDMQEKILSIMPNELSIAQVPTPKQYRHPWSADGGWLIILGTGFDKTPHVPISDELMQRVREILQSEEPAAWWSMRKFTYPHPKVWLA